ncbi:MAG: 50S ribosomal protein LX [Thermofilum sp. ex4484_15]|nr:MAG: 50S ribosomal protein LX [Thermofilum sp. ex4484_15]
MKVRAFRVVGEMWTRWGWQKFNIEKTGIHEKEVLERVLSEIGSRHRLKRKLIRIKEIRELREEEVEDPLVKDLLSLTSITVRYGRR